MPSFGKKLMSLIWEIWSCLVSMIVIVIRFIPLAYYMRYIRGITTSKQRYKEECDELLKFVGFESGPKRVWEVSRVGLAIFSEYYKTLMIGKDIKCFILQKACSFKGPFTIIQGIFI